jgi:hypothetical protein
LLQVGCCGAFPVVDRVPARAADRAHGTCVQKRGAAVAFERARVKAQAAVIKSLERAEKRR